MPPAETYRDLLMHRGYGYPLWEPNPREALPVELADGTFQGPLCAYSCQTLICTTLSGIRRAREVLQIVQCKIAVGRS